MISLAGAECRTVVTHRMNDFQIDTDRLNEKIDKNTKLIIINSPNNPTGMIYSQNTIKAVTEIAIKNDITILSDEIYEDIIFDNHKHISPAMIEDARENSIIVSGVSKSFAMTGFRLGWMLSPVEIIQAASRLQSHTTNHASSISQRGALGALSDKTCDSSELIAQLSRNRDVAIESLKALQGISFSIPQGAFYLLLDCTELLQNNKSNKVADSVTLAEFLLEQKNVALMAGDGFGTKNCLRLSFAGKEETVRDGCDRLKSGLELLA
jgi:aspartate aminotransferase